MLWAKLFLRLRNVLLKPGEVLGSMRRVVCTRNKGRIMRSLLFEK